jgi:uncharacterized protein YjiS (DUF1127 family)
VEAKGNRTKSTLQIVLLEHTAMASYLHRASAIRFGLRDRSCRAALLANFIEWLRLCSRRRRQRRELVEYLASDHRAAADLGITHYDARDWCERPFWRD